MKDYYVEHIYHVDYREIIFDFTLNESGQYEHQSDPKEKVLSVSSPLEVSIFNPIIFTEQASANDVDSNHEWFYDDDSGVLYFKDSNPKESFGDSGDFIIVTKRMYLSDLVDQYQPQDPTNSSSKTRLYQNRGLDKPEIQEDISSNYFGILSLSTSNLEFNNSDGFFENKVSKSVTFNGGNVTVFRRFSIDDDFKPVSSAPIRNLTFNKESAKIELSDLSLGLDSPFNRLSGINPDGDKVTWDSWLVVSPDASPSIVSDHADFPIVDIVGQFSPCGVMSGARSGNVNFEFTEQNSVTGISYVLNKDELIQCANIDDSGVASSTNNRKWGVCTMNSSNNNVLKDFTMRDNSSQNATVIDLSIGNKFQDIFNYITPGEWCLVYPGSGGTTYFTKCVQHYNGDLYFEPRVPAPGGDDTTFTATITFFSVPVMFIDQGGETYEISPDHYSIDVISSSDIVYPGQSIFIITFDDGFESSISGLGDLEPTANVRARCRNVDNATQGIVDLLQTLLEDRGIVIDSDSFDAFKINYNPPVALKYNSDKTYKELIELALESFIGFLYFDESGKLALDNHQFNRNTIDVSSDSIFLGSESLDMAYPDIFTSMVITHENFQQKSYGLGLKIKLSCSEAAEFYKNSAVRNFRTILAPTAWGKYSAGSIAGTLLNFDTFDESLIFDVSVLIDYLKNQTMNFFIINFDGSGDLRTYKVGDTMTLSGQRGNFKDIKIKSSYKSTQGISASVEGYGFEPQGLGADDFTVQTAYPYKQNGQRWIHTT